MINYKVIGPLLVIVVLLTILFLQTFERKDVSAADWSTNYQYEFKDPYGTWMLDKILGLSYGEEHIVRIEKDDFSMINSQARHKGYLYIDTYIDFPKSRVDSLINFVEAGNSAMIISDYWNDNVDLIFPYLTIGEEYIDSTACLSVDNEEEDYVMRSYARQLDSAIVGYHSTLHIDEDSIQYDYDIISTIDRAYPIAIHLKYGEGDFFFHSVPYLFTNVGLDQEDMRAYTLKVLPLLDIDTLYSDHDHLDFYNDYDIRKSRADIGEQYGGGRPQNDRSPIQFIMANPALSWAYYVMAAGLIIFIISRGRRRQRIIPTLEQNENTSLEYVDTVSELYRSQNQHFKLAKHLKSVFESQIKKKYYLKPGTDNYVKRLSQKSRIPEDDIQSLINRLKASENNKRFDDIQLINLHKDLDQFYKKCQEHG